MLREGDMALSTLTCVRDSSPVGGEDYGSGFGLEVGEAFRSEWMRSMLAVPAVIRPERGLSRSAVSDITTAAVSGVSTILIKRRRRTAKPEVRHARIAMIESITHVLNGMRFSILAIWFSLSSIVSFKD